MSVAARVDAWLVRNAGYPYLRLTRDDGIFDRVFYLRHLLEGTGKKVRLLDAGCGSAFALYMIERYIPHLVSEYVGIDLNAKRHQERYAHYKTPHAFYNVNLDDGFDFGQFDVVWCAECLEHIIDDGAVFGSLVNATRPGGRVIVTMPSEANRLALGSVMPDLLKISPVQNGDHVRLGYTHDSMRKLAAGKPCELVRIDAVGGGDETYMSRRYYWPHYAQPLRATMCTLSRSEQNWFKLNAEPADLINYNSAAAEFRVAP